MKILRNIGSLAFVLGLFVVIFAGIPWHVMVADDPIVPWWLRASVFCLLGGILVVLATVALEQAKNKPKAVLPEPAQTDSGILLLDHAYIHNRYQIRNRSNFFYHVYYL